MNHLLEDDEEGFEKRERELTLSTGVLLLIFVGLIALCGMFFGLGYSLHGSKPAQTMATDTAVTPNTPSNPSPGAAAKPSAGSPVGSVTTIPVPPTQTLATSGSKSVATVSQPATPAPVAPVSAPIVRVPPTKEAPTPIITGEYIVQIAAITQAHKGDADILVSALRAKGYAVNAFPEPDNLIHVQVGPFKSKPGAEAMRQRLVADGYQPYLKQQ
jgi:cell division septation protein DedD